MFWQLGRAIGLACVGLLLLVPAPRASAAGPTEQVQATLAQLDQWLGQTPNAAGWRKFLKSEALTAELAKGDAADREVVAGILAQYASGKPGLDLPRFSAVREALAAWSGALNQPKPEELVQLVRTAKEKFQPVTADQVSKAKAELVAATSDLDNWLTRSGPQTSAGWRTFLHWDDLAKLVAAAEPPTAEAAQGLVDRFTANQRGLELGKFTRVRIALQNYEAAATAAADAKLPEQYGQQLDELATQLEAYQKDAAAGDPAIAISRSLNWLARNHQGQDLVTAIRSTYSQPNLLGHVSQRLAAVGIEEDIDQVADVRDNILGTSLFGKARLKGKTTLAFAEDPNAAVFNILLKGTAHSNNVGYNRGVTLNSTGVTQISGAKRLQMTKDGMVGSPATANCQTNSSVNSLGARSGFVERAAWKRVGQSQGTANAIASDHAEVRVANQIDERANKMIAEQNDRYFNKFRNPLVRRGHFPQDMSFSTKTDRAQLRLLQAGGQRIAAPDAPPQHEADHDLAVLAHESLVVNFGEGTLANFYLSDIRLEQLLRDDLKTEVPEDLKVSDDKDPWAIRFARELPVRARFADGGLWLAIRASNFYRGEKDEDERAAADDYEVKLSDIIEISAKYEIARTPTGATLKRVGDVEVSFPSAAPGEVSLVRTATSGFLKVKFRNLFKEEFVGEGLALKGRWEKMGKLQLQEIKADKAWLSLGWQMPTPAAAEPDAAPPAGAASGAE